LARLHVKTLEIPKTEGLWRISQEGIAAFVGSARFRRSGIGGRATCLALQILPKSGVGNCNHPLDTLSERYSAQISNAVFGNNDPSICARRANRSIELAYNPTGRSIATRSRCGQCNNRQTSA
jgi:hypothetical protein